MMISLPICVCGGAGEAGQSPVYGLRDRAILSVRLQVGFRRSGIASLKVGDFHINRGYDALHVVRKGGKKGSLAIHPQTA